ncbi:DUF2029 domain-containing protein [Skermania piniformis]|uniref:DUF2029 domain-containing protein n=1 Tax=Skermania pinensis TaxID=39122 RepID=A0ABX8SGH8_9ACTN|nr:DUF2029 domain-containing protein [Skermania piniformis]
MAPDRRSATWRDLPSWTDSLASQLSRLVGGPIGRHALIGRARFWTPVRVVLAMAVVFLAFGWFGKAACIQQHPGDNGPALDWSNNRQYVAMCYTDIVPLYGAERLNEGAFPYKVSWVEDGSAGLPQVRYMEYPVVAGLYQYVVMRAAKAWDAVPWLPGALQVAIYFNMAALGLAAAWLVTVWATALSAGRRIWDSATLACTPLIAVHGFTNFDPLATAFAAGGMLAWARRRPALAGVLLGLGAATKLYPLFLLLPLLALCIRVSRLREWGVATATALVTWLAVNLPIAALFWNGWLEFFRLNTERNADPDSIYNVIKSFTGWPGFDGELGQGEPPVILNMVSLALFAAVAAGVGYVALTAPRRPRFPQLCFLLIAGFLLTNKVWSPQYSLWLTPLAVLAYPHRRVLLTWMTVDALVWVPRMFFYLGVDNKGLPEQWFTGAVVLRDIAVLSLCGLILYRIYHPDGDLVRAEGADDPAGGVLDHAPDRFPSRLPSRLRPRAAAVPAAAPPPEPVVSRV